MTEQSKIPVPDDSRPRRESLIERAAERFDLNRYIASPPVNRVPPPPRRGNPVAPAPERRVPDASRPEAASPEAASFEPASPKSVSPEAPVVEPVREPEEIVAPTQEPRFAPKPAPERPVADTKKFHPIDRDLLRETGMIVPEGSVTATLEEFRIVKRQLLAEAAEMRRANAGARAQRVLICSPHPGEGKTFCAVNLALAIAAEKECDVLLVDADFAKPSILSTLGLPGGPGLMNALMDEKVDVADFVIGTDVPGLWVLPAGDATTNDSEYLASSRTARVLDRLTRDAPNRMVIFDSPPALAASPAAELAKYVGQAVVVVRADQTGQGALEDAVTLLSACPNIQLLLNAAQFSPSGRKFGSYYGYKG